MTSTCACGSDRDFDQCCGPILAGGPAPTPEALMRSRYTAFTRGDVAYLETTLAPEATADFNREETETWAKQAQWQGLEIRGVAGGEAGEDQGMVEFVARYRMAGKTYAHHERALFRRDGERWLYVDGELNPKPAQRQVAKVGRNDPCPCGSGAKYKKCCGA